MSTRRPSGEVMDPPRIPPSLSGCLVIEFAGTPRAGKTSAIHSLAERLSDSGQRVRIVEERASTWPHPSKRHPYFNLWTATETATETSALLIEAVHAEMDVVLVDRGLFDALCWMEWYRRLGHLTREQHRAIDQFLRLAPFRDLIHLVFVMTVGPVEAIKRELATRLPTDQDRPGSILNTDTLIELNASIAAAAHRHRGEFRLERLDTTTMTRDRTLEEISRSVRALIPR